METPGMRFRVNDATYQITVIRLHMKTIAIPMSTESPKTRNVMGIRRFGLRGSG